MTVKSLRGTLPCCRSDSSKYRELEHEVCSRKVIVYFHFLASCLGPVVKRTFVNYRKWFGDKYYSSGSAMRVIVNTHSHELLACVKIF